MPREAAEAWLKYLREELPTVAFRCSTQKQRENVGQRRGGGRARDAPQSAAADHGASGSACLGADMLLQLLKKYSLAAGMKQAITVGERRPGNPPCSTQSDNPVPDSILTSPPWCYESLRSCILFCGRDSSANEQCRAQRCCKSHRE